MDEITLKRIELLHPAVRQEARDIYGEICEALTGNAICRFTHTLRDFAEQAQLYASGRTIKGPWKTNAKPGQSYHNYGLAIDICLIVDGKQAIWDMEKDFDGDKQADWIECVKVFKKYGWTWGGDWTKSPDGPHFEKTFGLKWQDMKKLYESGKFVEKSPYIVLI
jgi:peptidoglycan L-alanyl-D-glutamate endopeptidase CwlK